MWQYEKFTENVTLRKHKILINIKEEMRHNGAMGTMMSGSGPTVLHFLMICLKLKDASKKWKKSILMYLLQEQFSL